MTRTANRFTKGTACYNCRCCGRATRDTGRGDNDGVQLCVECFELAGYENMLSDSRTLSDSDVATVRQYLNELCHKVDLEVVRNQFTSLVTYVDFQGPLLGEPVRPVTPIPMDSELVTYLVTVTGPDLEILMAVDAKCSYHARRVAKRTVKAERSIDGLSFNARKA